MATTKSVYKNALQGVPLISTISSSCKTPLIDIKFSNLVKPFYYPNSPTIPRYSVTCLIDPDKCEEFIKGVECIAKNEGVESIFKNETKKEKDEYVFTGKYLIKFQGKDLIPVFKVNKDKTEEEITLEDELAAGEKVIIVYDILRYTKKNTLKTEHGISFKPTKIYYYPKAK